jgi:hypothetical protein
MAPGLTTATEPPSAHAAPKNIFPDGIRTSGQHVPIYEKLRPYADFPKEITGRTVWKREDFVDRPEAWTHVFTPAEIEELGVTADKFLNKGIKAEAISKVGIRGSKNDIFAYQRSCRKTFHYQT